MSNFAKLLNKYAITVTCFILFCVLTLSHVITKSMVKRNMQEQVTHEVERRVALDLNHINLPNQFLHHSGNEMMVKRYINLLNSLLDSNSNVYLVALNNIGISDNKFLDFTTFTHSLQTPQGVIKLTYQYDQSAFKALDYAVFLFSILLCGLVYLLLTRRAAIISENKAEQQSVLNQQNQAEVPILIVNLKNKSLSASTDAEHVITLANKPLCFYLALIDYSIAHPDVVLNQNKEVPLELINLSNKYFYRLVELGHTIRKRPNFSNSLEKTLSEIRASLDEVWGDNNEHKERYYPPKAHGEGSRSRLHHYGLKAICSDDFEVIGK